MEANSTNIEARPVAAAAGSNTSDGSGHNDTNLERGTASNESTGVERLLTEALDPASGLLSMRALNPQSNTEITSGVERYLPSYEKLEPEPDRESLKKLQTLLEETIPKEDKEKYEKDLAALRGEQLTGTYGDTTARLFTELLQRLETRVLPEYLRQLQSRELTVPAGAPQFFAPALPFTNGQFVPVDLHTPQVNHPALRADLKIDPTKPPGQADLKKLGDIYTWLQLSRNQLAEADGKTIDNLLIRQIKAEGLPDTWLPKDGDDRDKWRIAVANLLDSIFQTKKYAEATRIVNEIRIRSGQTPIPYPPAVEGVDQNGNIKYRDDFPPKDPRVDSSAKYLNDLAAWQSDWGQVVDYLSLKVALAKANPATLLTWADIPMQDKQAVFDKNGKFIDFVKDDGSYVPKDGETIQKFNLLESRFEVSERINAKGEKEIVVKQNVQPQQVPWYGYQNSIYDNVGQPFQQEHVFKPDEFVPVQSNNGLMLVQAKDLDRFRSGQKLDHYIHIGIAVTADVAMLLLLGPEAKGLQLAYKKLGQEAVELAARKLGTEVAEIGVLTSNEILLQTGKTSLRALAAASGILNNAGAQDTMWGRLLLEFRALYYMTDMGTGLMRLPLLNPNNRFAQLMLEGNGSLLKLMNSTGQKLLKVAEPAMVITSGQDLLKRVAGLLDLNSKNPLDQFKDPINKTVEPVKVPQSNGKLEASPELLETYRSVLLRDADDQSRAGIDTIFDTTRKLLQDRNEPGNAEKRKAYVDELLAPERFSEADIGKLNRLLQEYIIGPVVSPDRGPLTPTDLAVLFAGRLPTDAELEAYYPDGNRPLWLRSPHVAQKLIAEAQKMKAAAQLNETPAQRTARRIAALMLSAGSDGKVPDTLSTSVWGTVTEYGVLFPRDTTRAQDLNYQKLPFQISTRELTDSLQFDLAGLQSDFSPAGSIATAKNGDGMVIGDLLLRLGLIGKEQYAQVLQNIIESRSTTRQDKIDALLGNGTAGYGTVLGTIIEERLQAAANLQPVNAHYGAGTADFLNTLSKTASDATLDADVRAAAAVLLFLNRSDVNYQKSMLPRINDLWQQSKDKPLGTFAEAVALALRDVATNSGSSPAQLLNSGKALMELGGDHNKLAAAQALITAATASETVADMNNILKLLVQPGKESDRASVLDVLKKSDPEFAESFLSDTLSSINELMRSSPMSTINVKNNIPDLISTAMALASHGSDQQRAQLSQALRTMYATSAGSSAQEDVNMRRHALLAIGRLEGDASSVLLRQIVTDSLPQRTDASGRPLPNLESSAAIRILALSMLDSISQKKPESQEAYKAILRKLNADAHSNPDLDPVYKQAITELSTKYGVIDMPVEMPEYLSTASVPPHDKERLAEWLKKFFPLLDPANFAKARKQAEDSIGWFDRTFSSQTRYDELVAKAMEPVEQARQVQFDILAQQAFQTSTDRQAVEFSNQAKMVLYSIMMFNQNADGSGRQSLPSDWQRRAAEALVAAMVPGELGQSQAKGHIVNALLSGTLPPEIQQILIDGWIKNARPRSAVETDGPIGSSSSYIEYVGLLDRVLELAQQRHSREPSSQLSKLIGAIENARNEVMLTA